LRVRVIDKPGVQPIRHLLLDTEISEIMINGPRRLFVEKGGAMVQIPPVFNSAEQIDVLVENLLLHTGRAVTVRAPFVDFRLPTGERVNVVINPITLDGPAVTIRKATKSLNSMEDLVARGTLTTRMAYLLCTAIAAQLNIMFVGGTATGKTTTLGLLSAYIPESERIVVIEDTAELELRQANTVRMECRPPNIEGSGQITLSDLLKNSLRMRPTRLILGEIRGEEAFEMLNAMISGHDGCLGVMHASTPAHALARLELMVLSRGLPLPVWAIQRQIASALQLVVQHAQLRDGSRRITHISEVGEAADNEVKLHNIYEYRHDGYDEHGKAIGEFICTGRQPSFIEKLRHVSGDTVNTLLEAGPG
jgi:pilus assembly protein CpaF